MGSRNDKANTARSLAFLTCTYLSVGTRRLINKAPASPILLLAREPRLAPGTDPRSGLLRRLDLDSRSHVCLRPTATICMYVPQCPLDTDRTPARRCTVAYA